MSARLITKHGERVADRDEPVLRSPFDVPIDIDGPHYSRRREQWRALGVFTGRCLGLGFLLIVIALIAGLVIGRI